MLTDLIGEKTAALPSVKSHHSKDDLDVDQAKVAQDLLEWQHSTDDDNTSKAAIRNDAATSSQFDGDGMPKAISISSKPSETELQPDVSQYGDDTEEQQGEDIIAEVDDPFKEVDKLLSPDHVFQPVAVAVPELTEREKEKLAIESSIARLKQFLPKEMKKIEKVKSAKKQATFTMSASRERRSISKPSMSEILGRERSKFKKAKGRKRAKTKKTRLVSNSQEEIIVEENQEVVVDEELEQLQKEEFDQIADLPVDDEGDEDKEPTKASLMTDEESEGEFVVKLTAAERRKLAADEKRQRVLQRRLERQEAKKREAAEVQRIEELKRKAEEEMRKKQEEYEREKRERERLLEQEEEERYIRIREEEERIDREKRLMEEARQREAEMREKLKLEEEERIAAMRRAEEAEAKRRALEEQQLRLMAESERLALLEQKRKEEEERLRLLAEKERLDKIRHEREENERRNLEKKMLQMKLKAMQKHFLQLGISNDHTGIKKFSNITRSFVFSYFDLLPEMVRRDAVRLQGQKPERELIADVEKMLQLEDV